MCDNKNQNLNTGISFVAGAVVGALVGAAAVVLFNPTTGAENRKKVGAAAQKYSDKGGELLDEAMLHAERAKSAAAPYVKSAADKVTPVIHNLAKSGDKSTDSEQIAQLVEDDAEATQTSTPDKKESQKSKRYFKKTL